MGGKAKGKPFKDGNYVSGSGRKSGSGGARYEMASGLIHLSDSNRGDEKGTFVEYFGGPGPADEKNPILNDSGPFPGRAPELLGRWMKNGAGTIGGSKKGKK